MDKDSTSDDCSDAVVQSVRDKPPAHYILRIDLFSFFLEMLTESGEKCYDSEIFEASGHKWKLSLYPNGDKERNGEGHISLYLSIPDIDEMLPYGWEIYAEYKFFVLDQIREKYLIIQDADKKARQFREYKKEWGFARLIPRNVFDDATKGYLIQDKCVFGVEILVCNYNGNGERLCRPENLISNSTYTWELENFSTLPNKAFFSPVFTMGNIKWKVSLYSKGTNIEKGKIVSIFLELEDLKTTPRVYASYKMSIKNHKHGKHWECKGTRLFSTVRSSCGWNSFMSLIDISKSFLVKDTLRVEVEVTPISIVKSFT